MKTLKTFIRIAQGIRSYGAIIFLKFVKLTVDNLRSTLQSQNAKFHLYRCSMLLLLDGTEILTHEIKLNIDCLSGGKF